MQSWGLESSHFVKTRISLVGLFLLRNAWMVLNSLSTLFIAIREAWISEIVTETWGQGHTVFRLCWKKDRGDSWSSVCCGAHVYHSSFIPRWFVGRHRVKSWAPLVLAAVLCSGRYLWSPQEEWQKPLLYTSCLPTAGWPNWPAACPAWHTSPIRPLVCLALPNHAGHDECPGFIYPLF